MARITKFVKTIQNNWKKSVFGVAAVSYGISYAHEKYQINQLMRHYCAEASIYGDKTQPAHQPFPKVIVILNPVADKKSAADTFEKYCAPILNLGGLSIDIIKTESEGHARQYVEQLDALPQAILCAGGDGTLSEIVTGLFRRSNYSKEVQPVIGILPVGRENTFGERLFNFVNTSELNRVQGLADASLAIVLGNVVPKDVMRIELIQLDANEHAKPVYALNGFEWSAFTDAFYRRDKYWYYGRWRDYATFIYNAFSNSITWKCSATIKYTNPCAGCSNCYIAPHKLEAKPGQRRWWSGFIPSFRLGSSQSSHKGPDYSRVQNPNCAVQTSFECDSAGIIVNTNGNDVNALPHLDLKLIKGDSGFSFINDGWTRLNKQHINFEQENAIRCIEIVPNSSTNLDKSDQNEPQTTSPDQENSEQENPEPKPETNEPEKFFYIDHEAYEVKPIRITLLPKFVNFYSTKDK